MMLSTNAVIVAVCILIVKWNIADSSFVNSSQSITKEGGEIAVFNCTGKGAVWIVNGSSLDMTAIEKRKLNVSSVVSDQVLQTVQSNLTVPAITINNGTNVVCAIISDSITQTFGIEVNVTLIILPGIGKVRGLRFNNFFDMVIWDKPFTAGVLDDQLQYNVTVTNLDINSVIVDTVTNKTNHIVYSPQYCTRYRAVVTPFSFDLNGETISAEQKSPGEFYDLKNIMVNVTDIGVQTTFDVNLTINLMLIGLLPCPGQKLIYQTHPQSNVSDIVNHTEVVIEEHQLHYNFTTEFERKQLYTAIINRISDDGNIEAWMLNFSTFDIQGCDVHNDYTSILVECTFTNNSTAPGFVVIQDEQGHTINKMLQRLESSAKGSANITGLSTGVYSVKVFDQLEDSNPAYKNKAVLHQLSSTSIPTPTVRTTSIPENSPLIVPSTDNSTIIALSCIIALLFVILVGFLVFMVFIMVFIARKRRQENIHIEGSQIRQSGGGSKNGEVTINSEVPEEKGKDEQENEDMTNL